MCVFVFCKWFSPTSPFLSFLAISGAPWQAQAGADGQCQSPKAARAVGRVAKEGRKALLEESFMAVSRSVCSISSVLFAQDFLLKNIGEHGCRCLIPGGASSDLALSERHRSRSLTTSAATEEPARWLLKSTSSSSFSAVGNWSRTCVTATSRRQLRAPDHSVRLGAQGCGQSLIQRLRILPNRRRRYLVHRGETLLLEPYLSPTC